MVFVCEHTNSRSVLLKLEQVARSAGGWVKAPEGGGRERVRLLTAQPALLLDRARGGARLWLTLSNQMLNCSLSLSTCRMSHALLGLSWFRSCCLSSNAYWNAGAVAFAELFLILSPTWMTSSRELETCQAADV